VGKKLLKNPIFSSETQRLEVSIIPRDILEKIATLEAELAIERAKPAIVKTQQVTVEREVLRDDPSLLQKYNEAMRELGQMKLKIAPKEEHKVTEITKLVRVNVLDRKYIAASFVIGALSWPLFTHLGRLIVSLFR
jgi:hypothetical protein